MARIAVEKELQNQPDQQVEQPDQQIEHPEQQVEHPEQPEKQVEQSDQQIEQPAQQVEQPDQQTEQPNQQVEHLEQKIEHSEQQIEQPDQQVEQPDQLVDQPAQQVEQPDQHTEQLDQQTEQPGQQFEQPDQVNEKPDQQSEHSGHQNEADHLNGKQSNTVVPSISPDHTAGGNETQQKSLKAAATPTVSQTNEQHNDEIVATEQANPDPSNTQESTTVEEDATILVIPPEVTSEQTTQHQNDSTVEQPPSTHPPTDTQGAVDNEVPSDPTTTEDNNTSKIAELSVENVAAHDEAYPPVIERNTTQQTLTTVTMIDNPIRLEQLSRSSLDSDDSKKLLSQQITQQSSTSRNIGKEDDIIAIAGTVDTATMQSSISSSSLSNVSPLTDDETPTTQ